MSEYLTELRAYVSGFLMKAYGVMQFLHSNVLSLQMFTPCTVNYSSRQKWLTDSKSSSSVERQREREVF